MPPVGAAVKVAAGAGLTKNMWSLLRHPVMFTKTFGTVGVLKTLGGSVLGMAGDIMQMIYLSGIESKVEKVQESVDQLNTNSPDAYKHLNKLKMQTNRELEDIARERYELGKNKAPKTPSSTSQNMPPPGVGAQATPIKMTPDDLAKMNADAATAEIVSTKYAVLNEVNDLKAEMRNSFEESNRVMSNVNYTISDSSERLSSQIDEMNERLDDIKNDTIGVRETLVRMPQEQFENEMAQKMSPEEAKRKKKDGGFLSGMFSFIAKLGLTAALAAYVGKSVIDSIKKAFGLTWGDDEDPNMNIDRSEEEQLGKFVQGFTGDANKDGIEDSKLFFNLENKAKYRFGDKSVINLMQGQKIGNDDLEAIKKNREVLQNKVKAGTATEKDKESLKFIDENMESFKKEAEENEKGIPFYQLDMDIIKIFYGKFIDEELEKYKGFAPYLAYINVLKMVKYFSEEANDLSFNKLAAYVYEVNRVYLPTFMYRKGTKDSWLGKGIHGLFYGIDAMSFLTYCIPGAGLIFGTVLDQGVSYLAEGGEYLSSQYVGYSKTLYMYPSSLISGNKSYLKLFSDLQDKLGITKNRHERSYVSLNKIFEANGVDILVSPKNDLTRTQQYTYQVDEFMDLLINYLYVPVTTYNDIYARYLGLYTRIAKYMNDKMAGKKVTREEYKLDLASLPTITNAELSLNDLDKLQKIALSNDKDKAEKARKLWNDESYNSGFRMADNIDEKTGLSYIQYGDRYDEAGNLVARGVSEFDPLKDDEDNLRNGLMSLGDVSNAVINDPKNVLKNGPVHMGKLTPEILIKAAERIGLSSKDVNLTSGYRGPEDPLTKSNPTSAHTTGNAIDISVKDMTAARLGKKRSELEAMNPDTLHNLNYETARLYFNALKDVAPQDMFTGQNLEIPDGHNGWPGKSARIGDNNARKSKYFGLFHRIKGGADHFHFQNNEPYIDNANGNLHGGDGSQLNSSMKYTTRQGFGIALKSAKDFRQDWIKKHNSNPMDHLKYVEALKALYDMHNERTKNEFKGMEVGDVNENIPENIDLQPLKDAMAANILLNNELNKTLTQATQLLSTKLDMSLLAVQSISSNAASSKQQLDEVRSFLGGSGSRKVGV